MTLLGVRCGRWMGAALLVLAAGACSDDGVPQVSPDDADTDAGAVTMAGGTSDSAGDPSAVTTASTSPESATTDPSGPGDTDSGPSPTGAGSSSGGFTTGEGSGSTQGESETGTDTGGIGDECVVDDDCQIVDDCCTCDAIPIGDAPPKCDVPRCFAPTCATEGAGSPVAAECRLGTCVVPEVSCNPAEVLCDAPPPECSEGTLPTVEGLCWTGQCALAEHCDVVPSCDSCGDAEVCVEHVDNGGATVRCEPLPAACDGEPSCACMDAACEAPYDACSDGEGDGAALVCGCPAC